MSNLPIMVRALDCTISPANVRKRSDPQADALLEANIAENGVIQNLIGVPVSRKKGKFRIVGGGRRLGRVHSLIEKAVFDQDYEIPVLVLSNSNDAVSISLAENFFTLAMNPADACRAFQDIIATEGKTPADVAKRFGLTERFVLGRLRLASLAEPIFDALANGDITLDVAIAYASTSETERQAAVFAQMNGNYHRNNVAEIRRQIASLSYKGNDPKAILVGRDAYLQAGGRIEPDLFATVDTEVWLDTHIVDSLAEQALATAAAAVRKRDGFAEVRIISATHVPYADTHDLRPLRGERPSLTNEEEARTAELEEAIALLETQANEADLTEDNEKHRQTLEAELSAITKRAPIITDEQRAQAVAYVVIGPDGQPRVDEQLYLSPPGQDRQAAELDDGEGEPADPHGKPGNPTIGQRLTDELALMKTELVALHVANDPAFALDLGTFIMVETATRTAGMESIPSSLRAQAPMPKVAEFKSETHAAAQWAELDRGLNRNWFDHDTIEARYDGFCALPGEARAAWLGWAIAQTLHATPAGNSGSGLLDHIGRKLEIDVAAWWRPTARTYFDRITKPMILALFEEVGGAELRQRYGASKKPDLAASAERFFAGDIMVEAEVKAKAMAWLPDQMRFDHPTSEPSIQTCGEANVGETLVEIAQGGDDEIPEAA